MAWVGQGWRRAAQGGARRGAVLQPRTHFSTPCPPTFHPSQGVDDHAGRGHVRRLLCSPLQNTRHAVHQVLQADGERVFTWVNGWVGGGGAKAWWAGSAAGDVPTKAPVPRCSVLGTTASRRQGVALSTGSCWVAAWQLRGACLVQVLVVPGGCMPKVVRQGHLHRVALLDVYGRLDGRGGDAARGCDAALTCRHAGTCRTGGGGACHCPRSFVIRGGLQPTS